jgi:hypothetical protein
VRRPASPRAAALPRVYACPATARKYARLPPCRVKGKRLGFRVWGLGLGKGIGKDTV